MTGKKKILLIVIILLLGVAFIGIGFVLTQSTTKNKYEGRSGYRTGKKDRNGRR